MKPFYIKRFVDRAPRYTVQEDDDQSVRFLRRSRVKGKKKMSEQVIQSSSLINISSTGLAFKIEKNIGLEVGEKIKIEFPIPGFRQAAWWARVVRIQKKKKRDWFGDVTEDRKEEIVMGLHFCAMPVQHRDLISKEVNRKFKKIERMRKKMELKRWIQAIKDYGFKVVLLLLAVVLTIFLLYFLSRPSLKYHPSLGSPWGKRF